MFEFTFTYWFWLPLEFETLTVILVLPELCLCHLWELYIWRTIFLFRIHPLVTGDPTCEVRSWSRRPSQQRADNEDPHLESSQLLLSSASQISPGSPARRARCGSTAGFSINFNATRLLQLTVVSSAMVNYSASAACDECSGSSHNEFVATRPCETSIETVTLAAGWAKNNVQAVSVYALHPHRTSTKIPFRLCFHSFCSKWQISTEVHWLSGLRSAKNKNKIRWTWLLLLRPSRLEHSSVRPSWHYWSDYIPETTQECTFWSCLQLTIAGAPGRVV